MSLISITNLSLKIENKFLLKNINFALDKKTIHTLIGASGSGKSTILNLLIGLKPMNSILEYDEFLLFGKKYSTFTEKDFVNLRGSKISLIPQSPSRVFHPYIKIGEQILDYYKIKSPEFAKKEIILQQWENLNIRDYEKKYNLFPKFLSGGEKQRIIIKMVSALKPDILLADEPTTALDSINEKEILKTLMNTYDSFLNSILFVTHDTRIMQSVSDIVTVLKSGEIIEKITLLNQNIDIFQSKYSRKLVF